MSMTVGAAIAAGIGSAAGGVGSSIFDKVANYYYGGKAEKRSNRRTEDMSQRQIKTQAYADRWLYDYMQGSNYDYTRDYLENSAKWTLQGYENAGLNPMLAVNHGNISTSGVMANMPNLSSALSSAGSPVNGGTSTAEASRDMAGVLQTLSSADLQQTTAKNIETMQPVDRKLKDAQAEKTLAEADQIEANTALTNVRARNEGWTAGATGLIGGALGASGLAASGIGQGAKLAFDSLKHGWTSAKPSLINGWNKVKDFLSSHPNTSPAAQVGISDTTPSSAKGFFIPVKERGEYRHSAKPDWSYSTGGSSMRRFDQLFGKPIFLPDAEGKNDPKKILIKILNK